jgi:hypothetical protein
MVAANCDWNQIDGLNNGEAKVSSGLCPQFRGHGLATRALVLLHVLGANSVLSAALFAWNLRTKLRCLSRAVWGIVKRVQ